MDSEKQQCVLEGVIKFGPCEQKELTQLIPEYTTTEIISTLESLKTRGFITVKNVENRNSHWIRKEDVVCLNTDPFRLPDNNQKALTEKVPEEDIIADSLPSDVDTSRTITLELTPQQTKLFEQMRTNVSRDCGLMNQDEFVDWILREARRMTEV